MLSENAQGTADRHIELSSREQDVLQYLYGYWDRHYCAPTHREIATAMGLGSIGWVAQILHSLKRKDRIVVKGKRTARPKDWKKP